MLHTAYHFLQQLAENNHREWFMANKSLYEEALTEWLHFTSTLIEAYRKLIPLPLDDPKKYIFRIYRDVRFSKDKQPYKTHFAALIGEQGKNTQQHQAWYIHFSPAESFLAAGAYAPTTQQLAAIRQEIDYNGEQFRQIINEPALVQNFGQLQGQQLKTAPKGYDIHHPDIQYLRYNQLYFTHQIESRHFFKPDIVPYLVEKSALLLPFLKFLDEAVS